MFAVLLLYLGLSGYNYDHHDWLNLPAMDRIVSISTDNFSVYAAVTGGVYVIDKLNWALKQTISSADGVRGEVQAAGYDPELGKLWILSSGNLLMIEPFTRFSLSYELPQSGIDALGIDLGYIYLARRDEFYRLNKRTQELVPVPAAGRGVKWYGSKTPYRPQDYPFLTPYLYRDKHLNSYPITCVFPEGRKLWVGTEGYGLLLYSLTMKQPLGHWRIGPTAGSVQRIFRVGSELWFAGDQELVRYDAIQDSWSYFPTPFNVWYLDSALLLKSKLIDLGHREGILAVAGDSSGFLIGTDANIYSYDPQNDLLERILKLSTRATAMELDGDTIFIGTDAGLIRYNRRHRTWSMFRDTLRQMHFGVFGIAATERRRYYGVIGGVETQDSSGNWELITPPGFRLSSHPTALAAYRNLLFIGTTEGLLVFNEKNGSYTVINRDNGLLANRIESLYADDQYVWIATARGISRFRHRALFP